MDIIRVDRTVAQEAIADEVRAQMARKRISGVRAAKALGWTQQYIARRMIGAVPFDSVDLLALSMLLDVPVASFFDLPMDVRTLEPSGATSGVINLRRSARHSWTVAA